MSVDRMPDEALRQHVAMCRQVVESFKEGLEQQRQLGQQLLDAALAEVERRCSTQLYWNRDRDYGIYSAMGRNVRYRVLSFQRKVEIMDNSTRDTTTLATNIGVEDGKALCQRHFEQQMAEIMIKKRRHLLGEDGKPVELYAPLRPMIFEYTLYNTMRDVAVERGTFEAATADEAAEKARTMAERRGLGWACNYRRQKTGR